MQFGFLRRGRGLVTPLENMIVRTLEAALPSAAREILGRQIDALWKVNRDRQDAREVLLYLPKWLSSDPSVLFPNRRLEAKFARVTFTDGTGKIALSVATTVVMGRLFQILFSCPPSKLASPESLRVKAAKFFIDPMVAEEPVMPTPSPPQPADRLTGWLADWRLKAGISDLTAPRPPNEREQLAKRIEAAVPRDYIDLMSACDGFLLRNVAVLSLAEVYNVALPSGDYWILATKPDGALAAKGGARTGELYFCGYEGDAPRAMGTSFREALERLIAV